MGIEHLTAETQREQSLVVLSHYQASLLLEHKDRRGVVDVSADLTRTTISATIEADGVRFPNNVLLEWDDVAEINGNENGCFIVDDEGIEKIAAFSEVTGRVYTLYPTESAPTMLVSGLPMHRIKDTNPHEDTLAKVRAIRPHGRILDTATGLGYTAIEAGRTAASVVTVELDTAAQEIVALNPWSQELRTLGNIEQVIGDSFDVVQTFRDGEFQGIIHDPPVFGLGGQLYSAAFYTQLHRILARRGKLFHYIGNPESPSGRKTTKGVIARLKQVGFKRVTRYPEAFGVVAIR